MSPSSTVHGGQYEQICDVRVALACGIHGRQNFAISLNQLVAATVVLPTMLLFMLGKGWYGLIVKQIWDLDICKPIPGAQLHISTGQVNKSQ